MAARRLVIIMLVLLGVSSLAAVLVGNRPLNTTDSTTTTPPPEPAAPAGRAVDGRLLSLKVEVDDDRIQVVPVKAGDQLELTVASRKADQLEIPALGLLEPVALGSPARFDLLIEAPGSYGMRLVRADRLVLRIEVAKRPAKEKLPKKQGQG